jgi:uncharacterized protein YaiI (UPF0178 family)
MARLGPAGAQQGRCLWLTRHRVRQPVIFPGRTPAAVYSREQNIAVDSQLPQVAGYLTTGQRMVPVGDSADAADDWIAARIAAGDVCVTSDIPLASRCLNTRGGPQLTKPNRHMPRQRLAALSRRQLISVRHQDRYSHVIEVATDPAEQAFAQVRVVMIDAGRPALVIPSSRATSLTDTTDSSFRFRGFVARART